MNKLYTFFLKDSKQNQMHVDPLVHGFVVSAIIFSAILIQLVYFSDRFGMAYETGFQELVAKRHLDPGIGFTNGISTINHLGGEPTYHPTHPPALQWVLAGLFAIFGIEETSARLVPLLSIVLILAGIWRLGLQTGSYKIAYMALLAAACCPLTAYIGRVVNFEPPVLACIIWTLVIVNQVNQDTNPLHWALLIFLTLTGSLLDWPYQLFLTCLFFLTWFKSDRNPQTLRVTGIIWALSMLVSLLYVGIVYTIGGLDVVLHHIKIQSGAYVPQQGLQLPPIFETWQWWWKFFKVMLTFGTPVLTLSLCVWMVSSIFKKQFRTGLNHANWVLLVFCILYWSLFSRASHNHVWCYFYSLPVIALAFGLIAQHLRWWVIASLIGGTLFFSVPVIHNYFATRPLMASVQYGRVIDAADDFLPRHQRAPLNGPLLYVNRVDPLPFYANCETSFFSLSMGIPNQAFLVRHRPEFVVMTGYASQTSITYRPTYPRALFERLQKSYLLVHDQFNIQLWESLWSPNISVMGRLYDAGGHHFETSFIDDTESIHVGVRAIGGTNAVGIDLDGLLPQGKRWLHGWVLAQNRPEFSHISVQVHNGDVHYGYFQAYMQHHQPPKWQEFWVPIGELPTQMQLSWEGPPLLLGDLRIVSESVWTRDLTQLLASEIERLLPSPGYPAIVPMHETGQLQHAVLQHPGRGIDHIELAPIRIGFDQEMSLEYGLHPRVLGHSDGATFKLHMRDMALGTIETIVDETIELSPDSTETTMRHKTIDLKPHSRHVLQFSFEVGAGPAGDNISDHALWRNVVIRDKKK